MARRKGAKQEVRITVSPETIYARRKAAQWMRAVFDRGTNMGSYFFECLEWACGDLDPLLEGVYRASASLRSKAGKEAHEAVKQAISGPKHRYPRECDDLIDDHSCLRDIFTEQVSLFLDAAIFSETEGSELFQLARKHLETVFGLEGEALDLCEFTFLLDTFPRIEGYFESHLEVQRFGNQHLLARMLDIPLPRLTQLVEELMNFGILKEAYSFSFRLIEPILAFWSHEEMDSRQLFSRPLDSETLPLDSFHIAPEELRHIRRLMENCRSEPVHILLYGPSGTGKSTFVRSLAKACGVKAWSVNSRETDDDKARRASLSACLHLASKHEGSFVVVDEAERLLDTDLAFGRQTKDKAWLNDFLEKPGQRIVWISNQVRHIDPAVRRRFAYSLYFKALGVQERVEVWRQVMKREGLARRFSQKRMTELAKKFPVQAAVIQKAVVQSRTLFPAGQEFYDSLDRILQAHLALQNDGDFTPKKVHSAVHDFTLEGVCMEGDASSFMERCRRVDNAMRSRQELRPGCGTMLFYGPPGTGKTALARYIATELGRDCMVKRASDLLSPFVGMSEIQVAEAFREAEKSGAVLVIDEADTFLYSRESAQRSWENSLVNEFLTSLECCGGFCICTTNRREQLDPAAMRRFSHKVEFRYADSGQVQALYEALLTPLCEGELPDALRHRLTGMKCLAPGDFHAVRAQYDPLFTAPGEVTHELLVDALAREAELKIEQKERRVGFLG